MNLLPPPPLRLLPGAVTAVLFALLAVSVNENAAAQVTVATCTNPSNNPDASPGDDPHDTAINAANSCTASHQFIDAFPDLNTCGECIPDSQCTVSGRPGGFIYLLNGNRFCGNLAQCEAAGGMREGSANCEEPPTAAHHQACYDASAFASPIATRAFDTSSAPPSGDCRAARAGDEEICMAIDPAGSENIGYFTRVVGTYCASACEDSDELLQDQSVFTQMTSIPESVGQCISRQECDMRFRSDVANNLCLRAQNIGECGASEYLDAGSCTECPANQTRMTDTSCGPCQDNSMREEGEDACSCNAGHVPSGEECIPAENHAECWAVPLTGRLNPYFENGMCRPAESAAECAEVAAEVIAADPANSAQIGNILLEGSEGRQCSPPQSSEQCRDFDPMTPILGRQAINNIRIGSAPIGEARSAILGIMDTEMDACIPGTDARCAAAFLAEGLIGAADGSCRAPQNGRECRRLITDTQTLLPANPAAVYDDGNCIEACSGGEIPPEENDFICSGSCEAPNVEVGGECRLPTGNAECAGVGDGSAPIFDENEPTNCRAPEAGSECPTDQVLLTGASACTACTAPRTPNADRNACECADPNVEVGGECRLPAENAECATVGDGSTPIFDEEEPTNCRAPEAGSECPTGQVFENGACAACTAPRAANADRNACDCPDTHYEEPAPSDVCRLATDNEECAQVGDGSTPIFDEEEPTNCRAIDRGTDCPEGQVFENGACAACTGLLTPNTARTACECASPPNVEISGVCEAERMDDECTAPETVNDETNRCACQDPNVLVDDVCEVPETCAGNLTPNAQNECHCNPATHFGDTDSCVDHIRCEGDNEVRNAEDNTCRCADNFDGGLGNCTACTGGKTSAAGAACACPADTLPFENSDGVCEASREETCMEPRTLYNSATNACDCPAGQRLNAAMDACEAIPASGGGGGGGGGAAAAIIAVPVVLIGGYWLLGGFDYIDPTYNLDYSGENGNLSYRGDAGFDLNHGSLSSYARAIQSNGDAVSYESGISYGKDFYSLDYAAYESQSEYAYDLSANLNYGDGPWSISPTADAEFNYSADSEDWTADASTSLAATWTSHKWNIRAHSAFAGDLNHGLDVEFRF